MVGEGESMGEWRREAPCKRVDRAKKELTGEMNLGFKPFKVSGASPSFRGFIQFGNATRKPTTSDDAGFFGVDRAGVAVDLVEHGDGEDEQLCLGEVWCWVC